MNEEQKGYFLKEYGSWSVLIISCLVGLAVSKTFAWQIIPTFLALCLLTNSKSAFEKWVRPRKGNAQTRMVFLGQIIVAGAIFLAVFGGGVVLLLPLLIFPVAYLAMNKLAGEHFIVTELLGFVLISLATVIAKFALTGGVDIRLLVAVAFYFMAGVFKVKSLLLKKMSDRVMTALYLGIAVFAYRRMHISLIILLPLVDNLIVAIVQYKVKLQTTGWIEVAKSFVFLGLMMIFYQTMPA
jgi:YwiC-like protein